MLDHLKAKLTDNNGPQIIIAELSRPEWIYSLSKIHLEQLTKIVEGKQGNYKLHQKVSAAIYSIIIMRDHTAYNSKQAIQCLTKYYRHLAPAEQQSTKPESTFDSSTTPIHKTKAVLAGLLLRIPTFSNYKLIIKDISPELVSLSLFLQHRAAIIKQCPNLYQQFIVDRFKHIWPSLLIGDQSHFLIENQFSAISKGLMKISQTDNIIEIHKEYRKIEKICEFCRTRIELTQKQEINIEQIFTQLGKILKLEQNMQSGTIATLSLSSLQNTMIKKVKGSCLELLRTMILRFGYFLIRKFGWIIELINFIKNQPINSTSVQPLYVIDFWSTVLSTFGIGFYDFDTLVGKQQSDATSLITLISALCYNDYSMNNKQQTSTVNYQSNRNQKKSQTIQIHLYSGTCIDSSYEPYLKTTTAVQRDQLLYKILNFLTAYYEAKHKASMVLFRSSEVMHIMGTSKNVISQRNVAAFQNIKKNVMFKGYSKLSDGFEMFCDQVFSKYIKKKQQRKSKIHRSTVEVVIVPTISKQDFGKDSFMSYGNKSKAEQDGDFKRTNSFDVQLEGWSNRGDKKGEQRHKQDKDEKSEMFYSIKQCSEKEEKDKNIEEPEAQFLVTPEF